MEIYAFVAYWIHETIFSIPGGTAVCPPTIVLVSCKFLRLLPRGCDALAMKNYAACPLPLSPQ